MCTVDEAPGTAIVIVDEAPDTATSIVAHTPDTTLAVFGHRLRIGPARHGYVYTLLHPGVYPGLWKCDRGSDWARPSEVLFLFQTGGFWVAADAEEWETSLGAIAATGQPIFRTGENALEPGWHTWQTNPAGRGSTEWRSTGLSCETTRLQ